jgi:toxoflavin synthase
MHKEFQDQALVQMYQRTDEKPDKKYSILPTVLHLTGDVKGKTVLDLGCGSGFFTRRLAELDPKSVIGIDHSPEQIRLAQEKPVANIEFRLGNIFVDPLPPNDITMAPFVLCYSENVQDLERLLKNIYASLASDGRLVAVMDMPNGKNHRKFCAVKTLEEKKDGERMTIQLYDDQGDICTIHSHYFSPATTEALLAAVGFREFRWEKPMISSEGIAKYGKEFWDGYVDDPELGYLVAVK